MRRALMTVGLLVGIAVALFLVLRPESLPAQVLRDPPGPVPVKAQPPAAPLPISQVILFSSGVGYFQREGTIEGTSRIDLSFPVEDINDLLKSLVLRDLGGGHVSAVSYDSHDPIDKTLRSFAVNLTDNPTFGQLLNQARGEKVEVVLQQTNVTQPGTLAGTIIGIERQRQPAGKDAFVEVELLNLWCADGMRSMKLADVQRVRFLNPVLDNELKRALEVLALAHDTRKKTVSLSFSGEGKRPVRVGYVVENPIWKTSYRLVLGKDSKPFLQGWAIVENTSDEDWNNVNIALVSGRPISFQMDLYAPLYLKRPVVEPELFASLRPPTYTGAMEKERLGELVQDLDKAIKDQKVAIAKNRSVGGRTLDRNFEASAFAPGDPNKLDNVVAGLSPPLLQGSGAPYVNRLYRDQPMDLQKSVASAATATEMGDFFQYVIDQPVNLPRQKSAMLPIVNQNVEGTRVSIYNQATHAKFPLLGLKFKNTTDLHLMQGPITVFDGNSYAGDSRIMDLQPKEERLLSYAIDLGTEVEPVAKRDPDRLTAVKLFKGILNATNKVRESRTFHIKNRSELDRTLIIEHPFRPDFKLVTPEKPSERSRDVYRFELKVSAGKTASQEIVEERELVNQYTLNSIDDQTIRIFMTSTITSEKVKDALTQAMQLKAKLMTTQGEVADLNRQLQEITQDQGRLRANLKELPPTAAAYKRYLEKFDSQETEIERLQEQVKKLRQAEDQKRKEYEGYLLGLAVE